MPSSKNKKRKSFDADFQRASLESGSSVSESPIHMPDFNLFHQKLERYKTAVETLNSYAAFILKAEDYDKINIKKEKIRAELFREMKMIEEKITLFREIIIEEFKEEYAKEPKEEYAEKTKEEYAEKTKEEYAEKTKKEYEQFMQKLRDIKEIQSQINILIARTYHSLTYENSVLPCQILHSALAPNEPEKLNKIISQHLKAPADSSILKNGITSTSQPSHSNTNATGTYLTRLKGGARVASVQRADGSSEIFYRRDSKLSRNDRTRMAIIAVNQFMTNNPNATTVYIHGRAPKKLMRQIQLYCAARELKCDGHSVTPLTDADNPDIAALQKRLSNKSDPLFDKRIKKLAQEREELTTSITSQFDRATTDDSDHSRELDTESALSENESDLESEFDEFEERLIDEGEEPKEDDLPELDIDEEPEEDDFPELDIDDELAELDRVIEEDNAKKPHRP